MDPPTHAHAARLRCALTRRAAVASGACAAAGAALGAGRGAAEESPEAAAAAGRAATVSLALAGDVMTGRGVDQILPHPGDPRLYEPYMTSAADYVALAERAGGEIPRRVAWDYVWGDLLGELAARPADAFIINLETAVTGALEPAPKSINYRMSPANAPVLTAAGVDCAVLANNHVLDWGRAGLADTLDAIEAIGLPGAGAGRTAGEAAAPAVLPLGDGRRALVFAWGCADSGIPPDWAAESDRPGVNFLRDFSDASLEEIAATIDAWKGRGDIAIASIHWGSNWGYDIPDAHRRFARGLIDRARIDLVHGHSSHHPRAVEVHAGKLVLYGCGDFLNDYEGIRGRETFRGELVLLYRPELDARSGALRRLVMAPFRIHRFRLQRASGAEADWLRGVMDREARRFGARVRAVPERELVLDDFA
ncbi:poly-gamma-glutamate biosynthesis protein [Marinicauda salina]|uniref:Poly-gamma-glutamate biosynthesis protein n=2 Tax=Marinicauda salina TaxID=2135793 RepID=A0A2U2BYB5_9PROT|nr:poly-gamma-glutamate biosynthesis protein [Marinicauda salina]